MTHENRRALAGAVMWTGIAIIAVLLVFTIVQTFGLVSAVRETQQGNKSTLEAAQDAAEEAAKATDRIEDCTTPGQKCYDEGVKRQAEVIGDLNRVIAYAAACADKPGVQTQTDIYSCIVDLLAQDDESGG